MALCVWVTMTIYFSLLCLITTSRHQNIVKYVNWLYVVNSNAVDIIWICICTFMWLSTLGSLSSNHTHSVIILGLNWHLRSSHLIIKSFKIHYSVYSTILVCNLSRCFSIFQINYRIIFGRIKILSSFIFKSWIFFY